MIHDMLETGTLIELNQKEYPGCYLHRSDPTDVARTEHLTYVCTGERQDAGPNNNWMAPAEAKTKVGALFTGAMQGRTMYVVPYIMGPVTSPYSQIGVEITDSPYVAVSMRIMTRMGQAALDRLGSSDNYVKGLHALGDLSPERRFIMHFPEERLIWSVGSGYGGNALLGKKCFALRLGSYMAREEGWLAEHMLIVGIEEPSGRTTYVAAAFPSACGKTNMAMLVPPASQQGYKVWTVGEDIAWMNPGPDGRLWAINPEAGFFGVAPGSNSRTNPNVMQTIRQNTIFTNVGLTPNNTPYWEGHGWSTAVRGAGLAGPALDARKYYQGGASKLALHHPCASMSIDLAGMGKPARGAYLGDSVWWPSRQSYPVDLPVVQLATRRVPGGHHGVRDHGGGHWGRGRGTA